MTCTAQSRPGQTGTAQTHAGQEPAAPPGQHTPPVTHGPQVRPGQHDRPGRYPRSRRRAAPGRHGATGLTRMLGPGFVAAIAYADPGNIATNLTAGATSGYLLVWVVVAASLVAILVQFQAAKIGIATGRSLPELCRERFPRARWALWLQAELIVAATDLAEFVGAALGLRLLFGVPETLAAIVTGVLAMLMLELRRRGGRRLELVSAAALVLVGVGFGYVLLHVGHQSPRAFVDGLTPHLTGGDSLVLAMGIVGATIMPHAVYLHSAIARPAPANAANATGAAGAQDAGGVPGARQVRRGLQLDCGTALGTATLVNVSMIAVGAGLGSAMAGGWTGDLVAAHGALATRVGGAAALMFSIALLSSGLSSSGIGTLAGEVIMEGFLARRIPVRLRRLLTMAPAVLVLTLGVPVTGVLILSQALLSLGVPVALFLLVLFCQDQRLMGPLVNARLTTRLATGTGAAVAAVGCALPVLLLR